MRAMHGWIYRQVGHADGHRRGRFPALLVGVAALALAPSAQAASSVVKEEFAPFAACPVETAAVCAVANTEGGEFVLGRKAVTITKTITLQGGLPTKELTPQSLIGATGGETLSHTPLTVPGGLVGIEGLGGEVTATAELAGPPSSVIIREFQFVAGLEAAVTLPLKIKLSNETLGENCYIGSESEPIVLNLTTGATHPPAPAESLKGSHGTFTGLDKDRIHVYHGTSLVDNDFAVPGASGCGGALSPLVDLAVDADVGLPASPGQSKAVMDGTLEETAAELAKKYLPKPKKKKK
jgi:hypothetical protein